MESKFSVFEHVVRVPRGSGSYSVPFDGGGTNIATVVSLAGLAINLLFKLICARYLLSADEDLSSDINLKPRGSRFSCISSGGKTWSNLVAVPRVDTRSTLVGGPDGS